MKLGRASSPTHRDQLMVRLDVSIAEYPILLNLGFPWHHDPDTQEYLVHLSSVVFILDHEHFEGFLDRETEDLVDRYFLQCQRTFNATKRKPIDASYKWERFFTSEWTPRDYQRAGMEIVYDRLKDFSGQVLADDVGLGKTIQAIGVAERMRSEGAADSPKPGVVVVTTSTMKSQWVDEIRRFAASGPEVVLVEGPRAERAARMKAKADYHVLHYEMLELWLRIREGGSVPGGSINRYVRAAESLLDRCFLLILDETFKIRNSTARVSQAVEQWASRVEHTVQFNATPLEKNLDDLWQQYRCADKNVLGSRDGFRQRYCLVDETGRIVGHMNLTEFRRRTAILWLRRTAREVAADMPKVVAEFRPVEMSMKQTKLYRRAAGDFADETHRGVAMAKLAKVQYAALATDLVYKGKHLSAKLDDLESLLDGELSGEQIVVFTRFKRVLDIAMERFRRFHPLAISGATSARERSLARRRFTEKGSVFRLLFCTEAGDRGLNLQAAGVVGNLDLPWNHAKMRQRVGRVARIGQERRSILVINWIARQSGGTLTVDDYFARLIGDTRKLFGRIYGDDGVHELGDRRDRDKEVDIRAVQTYVRESLANKKRDR